ncbi:MAG: manganese efflux pump MntP [Desulfotomaculales bacterium]
MSAAALLLLALALGTDAFTLCLGIGTAGVSAGQTALISLSVLAFHIFMPLLGWQAGEVAGRLLGEAAGIVGAGILLFLGARMVRQSFLEDCPEGPEFVLVRGWGMLILAFSVSVDALAVGFTLGVTGAGLLLTALTIGLVAGLMTLGGLLLGRWLGRRVGGRAQLFGGLILIGMGVKLFF